jgi:Protein of unknown function DUF262
MQSERVPSTDDGEWEGQDAAVSDGWGEYPLDAVFVRTETRTVSEVVRRIKLGRFVLDPEFQREFVWPAEKQSKLIESCVMRIPLPVFYVAEARDGRIIVVDGLQRLTTFEHFLNDQLRLVGLASTQVSKSGQILENRTFSELPIPLQERIQDTQLTLYILDAKAPERARLDIFERVNSGEPLTRQQMRNALYSGPATRWLKCAAQSTEFQHATGHGLNDKTMRDREAINRFCAFKLLGEAAYTSSDMDRWLGEALTQLNQMESAEADDLLQTFRDTMRLHLQLFGEHAFRKSLASDRASPRSVINISLFEVASVLMSDRLVLDARPDQLETVRSAVIALVRDPAFDKAITYSTNSTAAVRLRFERMRAVLKDALSRAP